MSKRKRKSNNPNLPLETLERARLQAQQAREEAGLDSDIDEDEPAADEEDAAPASVVQVGRPAVENRQRREERDERRRSRRTPASASTRQVEPRQFSKRKSSADSGYVSNMLLHPTKFVSEAELHQDYGYVIADLRSMFLLATALVVMLIALAFFL